MAMLFASTRSDQGQRVRPLLTIVTVLVAAPLAVGLLAGCSASTPRTAQGYAASDGVGLQLGELDASNLLVLAAESGAPGTVLGSLTNLGPESMIVEIAAGGSTVTVRVAPHSTMILGPAGAQVALAAVPEPPGALMDVTITSDRAGDVAVQVPVLDGTLPAYTDLVPQT